MHQKQTRSVLRVAIIYGLWPHYRIPVGEALDRSSDVEFTFFSTDRPLFGIEPGDRSRIRRPVAAGLHRVMGLWFQPRGIALGLSRRYDAIIYLADAHYVSTWIGAAIARLRGRHVVFWGHGWRRDDETGFRRLVRHTFFRLANSVLVYSERGRQLGVEAGFLADRITVVYNSLDAERADAFVAAIEASPARAEDKPQRFFAQPDRPLLVCSARLTPECRFDLLVDAAAALRDAGRPVNLLLIGDGPERERLAAQAEARQVDVHFFGACYDEEVLGRLLYHSDVTVSPGKVGLTAIHSMMYGTPVITHGNLNAQMPEIETIAEGSTGALFREGDLADLVKTIAEWLESSRDRAEIRRACRATIHGKWNPRSQAAIIESVLQRDTARI